MTMTMVAAEVLEYPKIETLWDRDESTHKVIVGQLRCPEFAAVKRWHVTEKIDGTNVRVALLPDNTLFFGGRTAAAQMPPFLLDYLQRTFTVERMVATFRKEGGDALVVLYGEGYGPKIQKVGGTYRADVAMRLFDVRIGRVWLRQDALPAIADELGIHTAPLLASGIGLDDALTLVHRDSATAAMDGGSGCRHEGIIARSDPLMLDRMGQRVMWKLKAKDLA
jgi:ATP-dependent RNA circularization protein (DNA/RNA ligase family)